MPAQRLGEAVTRTRLALVVLVVLLFPLIGLPREDQRASLPVEYSYFYLADAALVALGLLGLPRVLATLRRSRTIETVLWTALYVLLFVAFVIQPSRSGVDLLIRLVAAAALYRTFADASRVWRRRIVVALGATAVLQTLVGIAQVTSGVPLGLTAFGEMTEGLVRNMNGPVQARGTVGHEYILTALSLLTGAILAGEALRSTRPAVWLVAAAAAVGATGLSYGRTAAVAVALVCAAFAWPAIRDARYRAVLVAIILGFGLTAIPFREGWAISFSRGLATQRVAMVEQAAVVVQERPFFGVGPGRYLEVLRSRPDLQTAPVIGNVHNVPAIVAAEAGIPAGIVAALLIAAVGLRAWRAGWLALALYGSFVLWTILDALPYVTPQGIVLTALWLGAIRHAERDPA